MLMIVRLFIVLVFQLVSSALIGQHTLDFVIPPCPHVGFSDTHQHAPGVSIFPNPASANLTIRFENLEEFQDNSVKLFNTWGKLVYERNIPTLSEKIVLDVSYFPSGIYILQIRLGTKLLNEKIVIKNE